MFFELAGNCTEKLRFNIPLFFHKLIEKVFKSYLQQGLSVASEIFYNMMNLYSIKISIHVFLLQFVKYMEP